MVIFIVGCGTTRKVITSPYQDSIQGDAAKISFLNAIPYLYEDGNPASKEFTVIKWIPSNFSTNNAIIYDDPENCIDRQTFDLKSKRDYKIPSGKILTFEYTVSADTGDKYTYCSNRFSFIPEANAEYVVKNSVHSHKIKFGSCIAKVYKSTDLKNPIDIISRDETPPPWVNSSPRCYQEELLSPVWVKESKNSFDCFIKKNSKDC